MSKTSDNKKKKRKWFQKGAFEDGYQFGDVLKSVVATVADVKENVVTGILGMGEKAVDAMVQVAPYFAESQFIQNGGYYNTTNEKAFKQQNNSAKNIAADFVKKDLYDENKVAKKITTDITKKITGIDAEKESVLGEKSDSLIQSTGQLIGQVGLQSLGIPWWLTTGVTSFGGETENAFKSGASYDNATLSAAITAGSEILSEKLFKGSGLGETGLINLSPLTKWISNKTIKTFGDYGIDILAEGAEEVFTEFMSNLGSSLYRNENLKDILFSKEAADGYLESFIGGAILGGVSNVGNTVDSIANKTDYRNGLTQNEQKVFDQMYSEAIANAKAENNGKRLSGKEKSQIYDNTLEQIKSGSVSPNVIEAALGGEAYSNYKNVNDNIATLQNEIDLIENVSPQAKTNEQVKRQEEARREIDNIKNTVDIDGLKQKLQKEIVGKITTDDIHLKNRQSYLADSYNTSIKENTGIKDAALSFKTDDEAAFIDGLLEGTGNTKKNNIEKSQSEIVDKITTHDIHLKDSQSYLADSYNTSTKENTGIKDAALSLKTDDEAAFIDGIWDTGKNNEYDNSAESVEKRDLENVDNVDESVIIEEKVDNDTGIPGEYTDEILWSIFKHLPVRKCGKGYFGKRIKQSNSRVDNYEMKINPNNESFYLLHPNGKYVQFENMKNSIVQDAKLVMSKRSLYYTEKLSTFMKQKLIKKAHKQLEAANASGYKLEWIVSDETAVEQLRKFFEEQNMDIIITYCPE